MYCVFNYYIYIISKTNYYNNISNNNKQLHFRKRNESNGIEKKTFSH